MVSKKKLATTAVASFGVAMASMYVSQDMHADVMDLTYGGAASATNPFFSGSGSPQTIAIDQVSSFAFVQWNDTFGGTGRTAPFFTGSVAGPMSMDTRMAGDVIDPNTFVGRVTTTSLGGMAPAVVGGGSEFDGTGSAFIAVRPRIGSGSTDNVYWFKIDFTQGGPIVYSCGQIGSMGEALTVGEGCDGGMKGCDFALGDVNMDGNVDLLDVDPFVAAVLAGEFVCEADANEDGVVDLLDVDPFVALILGG